MSLVGSCFEAWSVFTVSSVCFITRYEEHGSDCEPDFWWLVVKQQLPVFYPLQPSKNYYNLQKPHKPVTNVFLTRLISEESLFLRAHTLPTTRLRNMNTPTSFSRSRFKSCLTERFMINSGWKQTEKSAEPLFYELLRFSIFFYFFNFLGKWPVFVFTSPA